LLLKVIDIVLEEFSAFHSKFIIQQIDCFSIDDDELSGYITSLTDQFLGGRQLIWRALRRTKENL